MGSISKFCKGLWVTDYLFWKWGRSQTEGGKCNFYLESVSVKAIVPKSDNFRIVSSYNLRRWWGEEEARKTT